MAGADRNRATAYLMRSLHMLSGDVGAIIELYLGILAPIPGKMGIGVFSPGLDPYGNSVRGVAVCKEISDRLGLHVFATAGEDAVLGDGSPAETR